MDNYKKKHIAILGSSGSIGTQALEVVEANTDEFCVEVLTVNTNADLLIQQAKKFKPNAVVIVDETKYNYVKQALKNEYIKIFAGEESLSQIIQQENIDIVLTALVGYSGLKPTIKAIEAKKNIALANKETMVVAGKLITDLAKQYGVNIYPVDSEHSAIFQCLAGEWNNPIEKIYLTASGGPFLGKDADFLKTIKKEQALQHPNWSMGAKITIDSATLMNKGLEVIEAKWLFNLQSSQIDVIVHPQSIVHSIVQFEDGSMKAQMGLPDMKLPIQYALGYPNRLKSNYTRFDFLKYPSLTFTQPDLKTFKNLSLAYEAMKLCGNIPCALNAANEIAVASFLKDEISFLGITKVIEHTLQKISHITLPTLADYIQTDKESRIIATQFIKNI